MVVTTHQLPAKALEKEEYGTETAATKLRRALIYDQRLLALGGVATMMLSDAFSRLKGLKEVEIGVSMKTALPAFDADVDWIDVRNNKWSKCMAKIAKQCEIYPQKDQILSKVWLSPWTAISISGVCLESFKYMRRSIRSRIDIDNVSLCTTPLLNQLKVNGSNRLRTLHLCLEGPRTSGSLEW